MPSANDLLWMQCALRLAEAAAERGEVPVGAVLVRDGEVIGEGKNQPISTCDPSGHAEIVALRAAAVAQQNYRLPNTTLYVTIEPCTMCLGAMIHARVARLVFGAAEPKAGVVESQAKMHEAEYFNHKLDVEGGVLAGECSALMADFFKQRRKQRKVERKSELKSE